MTYRGHVENGVIVLDEAVALPEGVEVRVELVQEPSAATEAASRTVYERLKSVIGIAEGLPRDASVKADYYLYAHPKQ